MAPRVSDTIAQLRVCQAAGIAVPDDVLEDAIAELGRSANAHALKRQRDDLIRRAALLLPATEPWQRAEELARLAKLVQRVRAAIPAGEIAGEPVTPRACIEAAAKLGRLPGTARHYYRLLTS